MFRIGQKVVCVEDVNWRVGRGPKKDEVCTVSGVSLFEMLIFKEYDQNDSYNPKFFRPLGDDWAHEVLENVLVEIKENKLVDAP